MLDEIRSFFEDARDHDRVRWPEHLSTIGPGMIRELQTGFKNKGQLARQVLDDLESTVVGLYERGAGAPGMIDVIDEVVAIIRQKDETLDMRVVEILQLLQKGGVPIGRS
jgi:hypothetical protein